MSDERKSVEELADAAKEKWLKKRQASEEREHKQTGTMGFHHDDDEFESGFIAGYSAGESSERVMALVAYVRVMQDTLRAITMKMKHGLSATSAIVILESEIEHASTALAAWDKK